jgi:hypothetical protein
MKTKYVVPLGVALLCAAWAQAQTVYSVNVVGFQKILVPPGGFAFSATPFTQDTNDINAVVGEQGTDLADPNPDAIYTWNGTSYAKSQRFPITGASPLDGLWVDSSLANLATNDIPPGAGFIYKNGSQTETQEIVVVGEVIADAQTTVDIPSGLWMISYNYSSEIDLNNSTLAGITSQATAGDEIFAFNTDTQSYEKFSYFGLVGAPTLDYQWLDAAINPTSFAFEPGSCVFYRNANAGFVWTEDLPYDLSSP